LNPQSLGFEATVYLCKRMRKETAENAFNNIHDNVALSISENVSSLHTITDKAAADKVHQ